MPVKRCFVGGVESKKKSKKKRKYEKPQLKIEKVMAFGALCNGMTTGGRKAIAGPPDSCNTSKLLS